jgi:methyltransferase (TIGR00027 family)
VAEVLDFKAEVLAELRAEPRCSRVVIPIDLREDWPGALKEAGFRPDLPTVWLAEGILMYLTQDAGDRMLTAVSGLSAPRSRLIVEHRRFEMPTWREALAAVPLQIALALMKATWRSSLRDPVEWLRGHGFAANAPDPGVVAQQYGRTVLPLARAWLVHAVRL